MVQIWKKYGNSAKQSPKKFERNIKYENMVGTIFTEITEKTVQNGKIWCKVTKL